MSGEERAWFEEIEYLGIASLFKLVFTVLSLLLLAVLATALPGLERLEGVLPISITVLFRTLVTLAVIVLLLRIARQARPAIRDLESRDEGLRNSAAQIVHWGVILLAVGVAYEGLRPAGAIVFGYAGFETFYSILFGMMALIPLALLSVEFGLFARQTRESPDEHIVQPEDLRTDEQHVLLLLEKREGTIYQGELAEATGWSKAKVSRVLSGMEAEGTVVRFRVGRQKVVCLPGHEPGYVTSVST